MTSSGWSYKGAEKHIVNFDLWGVLVDKSGWITKLAVRINALFKVLLSRLLLLWICETLEGSSQRKISVNTMHFSASTKIGSNLSNFSLRKQPTYSHLGSNASSVWKICGRFSDIISWGKKVVASRNSTVFSGY